MVDQGLKDLYYLTLGKASVVSYWWHKLASASRLKGAILHIGCGLNYIPGLINIDGNLFRKKDIWLDVTLGLPCPPDTVRGIYVSHTLEHFSIRKVRRLLIEFHRVLQSGGSLRIVVPSLEYAIQAYLDRDPARFPGFPEEYRSLGGRFSNFMLCANQHPAMFDFYFMEELLTDASFRDIRHMAARTSQFLDSAHMKFESQDVHDAASLYVECLK